MSDLDKLRWTNYLWFGFVYFQIVILVLNIFGYCTDFTNLVLVVSGWIVTLLLNYELRIKPI